MDLERIRVNIDKDLPALAILCPPRECTYGTCKHRVIIINDAVLHVLYILYYITYRQ